VGQGRDLFGGEADADGELQAVLVGRAGVWQRMRCPGERPARDGGAGGAGERRGCDRDVCAALSAPFKSSDCYRSKRRISDLSELDRETRQPFPKTLRDAVECAQRRRKSPSETIKSRHIFDSTQQVGDRLSQNRLFGQAYKQNMILNCRTARIT
jgi:hypothetical protein